MNQANYQQLPDVDLQLLYTKQGDRQAFFEVYQRYKTRVMAQWKRYQPFLFRHYEEDFENYFDELLEEGLSRWNPARANFQTFFVRQVCRRRVIDFARKLWKRNRQEAKPISFVATPGQDEEIVGSEVLDAGSQPWKVDLGFSEQDLQFYREAFQREKTDCQELLRLMHYSGPKKFEEKAKVLAIMGFKKKATGWRDTWKRNRERISAYISAKRENL